MSELPPQNPSGYQPAQGEGLTSVEVEVLPSWGYQKVAIRGTYVFTEPRSLAEATQPIADVYAALEEQAANYVDALVALKDDKEGAKKAAVRQTAAAVTATAQAEPPRAPAPTTEADPDPVGEGHPQFAAQAADAPTWLVGKKPKGAGTFKYRPTADVPSDALIEQVKSLLAEQGVDPEQIVVFDDRTGKYGLEDGNESYSAAKAKARQETILSEVMGKRDTVAYVDFDEKTGAVTANLSKDAREALRALELHAKLGAKAVD